MTASSHLYPTTQTRLAAEVNNLVAHARAIDAVLPQLVAIAAQINIDGAPLLATEFGYPTADDATAAYGLLNSVMGELAVSPFWQQLLARMG